MNKFWIGAGTLLVLALLFITASMAGSGVEFRDLETECQYDRGEVSKVSLEDDQLHFDGHYPVQDTQATVDYKFSRSSNSVKLDIVTKEGEEFEDLTDRCRGVAVYDAHTSELDTGSYKVEVLHNGERAYSAWIRVKE